MSKEEEDTDEEDLELTESDGMEKGVTGSSHSEIKTCKILHFQLDLCFLRLRSLEKPSMSKCHE